MNTNLIKLMLNLVHKSSLINDTDEEYVKIKERILILNNKLLTNDIFYEQKFNVRLIKNLKIFLNESCVFFLLLLIDM